MPYAVNVADLTLPEVATVAAFLLGPVTPSRTIVNCGKNVDDGAVVLECDDKRAAAVCEILNTNRAVRCYVQGRGARWSMLKIEARKGAGKTKR